MLDVVLEASGAMRSLTTEVSFNPYCAGCSFGRTISLIPATTGVSFNPYCAGCSFGSAVPTNPSAPQASFNPYCAGCSFGRPLMLLPGTFESSVSILIVLDVVLEEWSKYTGTYSREFQSLLCWM